MYQFHRRVKIGAHALGAPAHFQGDGVASCESPCPPSPPSEGLQERARAREREREREKRERESDKKRERKKERKEREEKVVVVVVVVVER